MNCPPVHPCVHCGVTWNGPDDDAHGTHFRQATCGHMARFGCKLRPLGGLCSCSMGADVPTDPIDPAHFGSSLSWIGVSIAPDAWPITSCSRCGKVDFPSIAPGTPEWAAYIDALEAKHLFCREAT